MAVTMMRRVSSMRARTTRRRRLAAEHRVNMEVLRASAASILRLRSFVARGRARESEVALRAKTPSEIAIPLRYWPLPHLLVLGKRGRVLVPRYGALTPKTPPD